MKQKLLLSVIVFFIITILIIAGAIINNSRHKTVVTTPPSPTPNGIEEASKLIVLRIYIEGQKKYERTIPNPSFLQKGERQYEALYFHYNQKGEAVVDSTYARNNAGEQVHYFSPKFSSIDIYIHKDHINNGGVSSRNFELLEDPKYGWNTRENATKGEVRYKISPKVNEGRLIFSELEFDGKPDLYIELATEEK